MTETSKTTTVVLNILRCVLDATQSELRQIHPVLESSSPHHRSHGDGLAKAIVELSAGLDETIQAYIRAVEHRPTSDR